MDRAEILKAASSPVTCPSYPHGPYRFFRREYLIITYETDPDAVYFRSERNLLDPQQRRMLRDLADILGFRSTSDPIAWLRADERDELRAWLESRPVIERVGRFRWRIDGRDVDLGPAVDGSYRAPEVTVAG